jgi:transcriptional regulator with XRE-family HTH domain
MKQYKDEQTLRRLFHEESLTQSEMAERLDCAHGTVSNWMRKYDIETRKETEYQCQQCQKVVEKYPSQVTGENFFCSRTCYGDWLSENKTKENHPRWEGGVDELTCDNCGETYQKHQSKIIWNHQFCTKECYYGWRMKDDPQYIYYGKNWESHADKALQENEVCQRKGCRKEKCENGAKLHVHHLTPVKEFDEPEDAHFSENLVVLCAKHHQRIESKENQLELIQ